MHTGKSGRLFVGAVALALCCGGPPGADETAVDIKLQPLDSEVQIPFVAMGHSSSFLPYGGKAIITPADAGIVRSANISFDDVPEGESYRVDYVGYHQLPTFPARPGFASPWLCYWDRATRILRVVSGVRNLADLEPDPVRDRCVYLAADRYVVNPNYFADPYDARYGAIDRENAVGLFIHGMTPRTAVTVLACDTIDPSCTAPFGLFETLPDGDLNLWASHTGSGWVRELTVTTDGLGDATLWAVVKPGSNPQLWDLEVRYPSGTTPSSEVFRVRISNGNRVEVHAE